MAVLLALCAAIAFGCSDFAAGVASRRFPAAAITCAVMAIGACTALASTLPFPGTDLTAGALGWGALSGIGGAGGTYALYRGLAIGRMSVVATVSAVLGATAPVLFGVAIGESLGVLAAVGIVIAFPAIGLVSWRTPAEKVAGESPRQSVQLAILAGVGFGLLFIALDRAGTHAGAWPVVAGQLFGCLLVAPLARRALRAVRLPARATVGLILIAGVLSAGGNLLFLAATGRAELAIVAVIGALYPAATVLLARLVLAERFTRTQACGLALALAAIVLVSA